MQSTHLMEFKMDSKENMYISIDFDFSKFKFNRGLDDKLDSIILKD